VTNDLFGFARYGFDRWISLRGAEAAAEALPDTQRGSVAKLVTAGRARCEAALGQRGVAALVLARAAIPLYLDATITAHGEAPPADDATFDDLWSSYDDLVARRLVAPLPHSLEPVREQTVAGESLDDEIAAHGDGRIEATLALASFLAEAIEVRTPGRVRAERRLRYAGLALFGVLLVAEVIVHRPKGANVALDAAVVASSRRPGSGPPQDLTNGKVEVGVAFSTRDEADPWIMLDFVKPHRIHEMTLVNSPDHPDDSLPLRAETSVDGATWAPAASRRTPFTPADPAVLSFAKRSARFVRVHGKPGGAIYLSEIEVR
jgi:hypothetical protein